MTATERPGTLTDRRSRPAVVVVAGDVTESDVPRTLSDFLQEHRAEAVYIGWESNAERIAAAVSHHHADAVELWMKRGGGVTLLRQFLHELANIGRREVSIVVRRIDRR